MARYNVLETSFINNAVYEAGSVIEYDGEVAGNLELIDDEKPKAKKAAPAADEPLV